MENTALLLIVLTNAFLVVIVGVLVFFVYKMILKNQGKSEPIQPAAGPYHPEALARINELKKIKVKPSFMCANHPEEPSEASCTICDRMFCKACVKPFKSMHVCHEHYALVMGNNWDEVLTLKTSTTDPEKGVKLYDVKKDLFYKEDIPCYVETHYKINVDHDFIETYLVLFAQTEHLSQVKTKFEKTLSL